MPPPTPRALADDLRSSGGHWTLYGARFVRCFADDATHRPGAWFTISGPTCCAEIELSARSPSQARRVRAALRRAGYHVGRILEKNWMFARRPLRGIRELAREARHLEAIAIDPETLTRLPLRAARPVAFPSGAFPVAAFEYLQGLPEWTWSWVAAERRGRPAFLPDGEEWSVLAWCSLLTAPDEEPDLDLGVQVFPTGRNEPVDRTRFARIKRALAAQLRPHGYRPLGVRAKSGAGPASFLMLRRVDSLSSARAGRRRLERLISSE
jgi:hypothetical protein